MGVSFKELRKATDSLKIALNENYSDIVRDASIQRFEFCIELTWKLLKKQMGSTSVAPKAIIREAAQQGLIDDPKLWLQFIDARNMTSHTYNEETAREVFECVKTFLPELELLLPKIESL